MDPFLHAFNEMLTTTYRSICKVEELMLRKLSSGELSLHEMHMLESIGKHKGEDVTITDLAQDLDITPPSVTAMVKRLEHKGFITKSRSGVDARRVCILLTEQGRRAEVAHRLFHRKMVRAITKDLTDTEREAIATGLKKMNAFMDEGIRECINGKEEKQ